MSAKHQCFCAIAVLASISCLGSKREGRSSADTPDSSFAFNHAGLHPERLKGKALVRSGLSLPVAVGLIDPFLVVADKTGSDSMVKVYDRESGKLELAFGRLGGGPGEFRDIWAIRSGLRSSREHPVGWAFDFTLRRLTAIELGSEGLRLQASDRLLITMRPEASLTGTVWVDDSTIGALGFFQEGRVGLFDRTGKQRRVVGPMPVPGGEIPARVLQHAYQSSLAARPDGSQLVAATRHAGRIEILSSNGDGYKVVKGPFYFEPTFRVGEGMDSAKTPIFTSGIDLRFGYLSVCATDSLIFALFSGRMRRGFPGEANYGQFVHVFDWSGKFIRAYDLGEAVFTIDVDREGRELFAARHNPSPAILAFALQDAQ